MTRRNGKTTKRRPREQQNDDATTQRTTKRRNGETMKRRTREQQNDDTTTQRTTKRENNEATNEEPNNDETAKQWNDEPGNDKTTTQRHTERRNDERRTDETATNDRTNDDTTKRLKYITPVTRKCTLHSVGSFTHQVFPKLSNCNYAIDTWSLFRSCRSQIGIESASRGSHDMLFFSHATICFF